MNRIRIFLADDHALVRQAVRVFLQTDRDLLVVGESGDGIETLRSLEQLAPDVLVTDLCMAGLGGVEIIRSVTNSSRATRIVVLSMHTTERHVLEALRAGASAYVAKSAAGHYLFEAIREAAAGRRFLSPPLSDLATSAYLRSSIPSPRDRYDTLTARERQVFQLVAEGLSSGEIGRRLFISTRTVEVHRANLSRKLGLKTYTDLVRYASKRGMIPAVQAEVLPVDLLPQEPTLRPAA